MKNYKRTKDISCFSVLKRSDLLEAYKKVRKGKRFLSDKDFLRYKTEDKNSLGKYYADYKPFGDINFQELVTDLHAGNYVITNYTAVVLPKGGGDYRTILVPAPRDRVVFSTILQKLKVILLPEINLYNIFGSGKRKDYPNIKSIVASVHKASKANNHVLKIDIKKFFPSINKEALVSLLETRTSDSVILDIVENSFNTDINFRFGTNILSKEKRQEIEEKAKKGIPQGCAYSPLLANYYALPLDQKVRELGAYTSFRYLDDMIVFTPTKQEAMNIFSKLEKVATDLGLSIHPISTKVKNKSYIQKSNQKFEYLGIEIHEDGSYTIPVNKIIKEVKLIKAGILNQQLLKKFGEERVYKTLTEHIKGWKDYYANNFPTAYTQIRLKHSLYNKKLKEHYNTHKSFKVFLKKKQISIDDPRFYL